MKGHQADRRPRSLTGIKIPRLFCGAREAGARGVDFLFGSSVAGSEINLASPILSSNRAYKYRCLEAAGQGWCRLELGVGKVGGKGDKTQR